MSAKETVIYLRCAVEPLIGRSTQEIAVRDTLSRKGIDHSNAIVINDRGESGSRANRAGLRQLVAMCESGRMGLLAVDDRSRLSRGRDADAIIQLLKSQGGRFVSVREGLDTAERAKAI